MTRPKRRNHAIGRRWLFRVAIVLLLLPVVLFFASNLILTSSWGKDFLSKKLDQKFPTLKWSISQVRWSPWRGVSVKGLEANFANLDSKSEKSRPPAFELEEVNVKPYWGQMFRGKKLFREIIVEKPTINIPIEYLAAQSSESSIPVLSTAEPAPATSKESAEPKQTKPKSSPTKPKAKKTAPKKNNKASNKPKKSQKKNQPKAKPESKKKPKSQPTPDERRLWYRLRNANVRFYSEKTNHALQISDLNLNLPVAGPPTTGTVSWQKVTLAGRPILEKTSLPVAWKNPAWTLENQELALQLPSLESKDAAPLPLVLNLGGVLAIRSPGAPFQLAASLPPQPLPDYIIEPSSQLLVRSPSMAFKFVCKGSLPSPSLWQFDSAFAMNQLEAFSQLRGQHFLFDTAQVNLGLKNGVLHAPSIALRSERLSLLGNSQCTLNGYLLGVLRIVAAPDLSERITQVAIGSGISRGWMSHWMKPLETPDRRYRDLHFEGPLPNAQVNTGRKGQFISLPQALSLLQRFREIEVAEEVTKPS